MILFSFYGNNRPSERLQPGDIAFFEQENGTWFVNRIAQGGWWDTHPLRIPKNWFIA